MIVKSPSPPKEIIASSTKVIFPITSTLPVPLGSSVIFALDTVLEILFPAILILPKVVDPVDKVLTFIVLKKAPSHLKLLEPKSCVLFALGKKSLSILPVTVIVSEVALPKSTLPFAFNNPSRLVCPVNVCAPVTANVPAIIVSPDDAVTLNLSVLMSKLPSIPVVPLTPNVVIVVAPLTPSVLEIVAVPVIAVLPDSDIVPAP